MKRRIAILIWALIFCQLAYYTYVYFSEKTEILNETRKMTVQDVLDLINEEFGMERKNDCSITPRSCKDKEKVQG